MGQQVLGDSRREQDDETCGYSRSRGAFGAKFKTSTLAMCAETAVYKLDGSESVNKTAMGESKSKASRDGGNLVLAGKQAITTQ